MWKNIPINIPYGLFYSIIIIVLFYIISSISEKYIPKLKMGGADFIAISIVLISSLPVHQNFALLYVKYFIAASLLSILASVLYNRYYKKGNMFTYILPLIVPITIAYYALMVTFFVNGDVTFLIK
jgi:hypothetical protein